MQLAEQHLHMHNSQFKLRSATSSYSALA